MLTRVQTTLIFVPHLPKGRVELHHVAVLVCRGRELQAAGHGDHAAVVVPLRRHHAHARVDQDGHWARKGGGGVVKAHLKISSGSYFRCNTINKHHCSK